jgi:hypothetical protein
MSVCVLFVGCLQITNYNAKLVLHLCCPFSLLNAKCFRLHDGYLGGIPVRRVTMNENYTKHT